MFRFLKRASLVVVCFIVTASAILMYRQRNEYIQILPLGIYSQARTYENAKGNQVVLIGMAHIALPEFYAEIKKDYGQLFALNEGVTDKNKIFVKHIGYAGFAKSVGLEAQQKDMFPRGIRADSDVSELPPDVIKNLQQSFEFFDLFDEKLSDSEKQLKMKALSEKFKANPKLSLDEDSIIIRRNEVMLKHFKENEDKGLVIPWGASHMVQIEEYLKANNYFLKEVRKYKLVDYYHLAKGLILISKTAKQLEDQ